MNSRELLAAQAIQCKSTKRVIVRYRPGIDPSMRILHRDQVYNIDGIIEDPDSGREFLTLPVTEGVNDG